ncbi:chloride channel protein [Rhodoblastus acidophilus]|uniref:Chloride channel protein n=1 Tax=Candidatus Rhodoblastus alkanivorans TaxID=2954117 RepID=A0ABS9Z2Z2_9HYPH|nr:chloride channel protein [Candidatus Rhodoblastus alkanivorans]MCI4682031.1 chloride channel protein [Candidatus Rhodoblastus alkanivorans]
MIFRDLIGLFHNISFHGRFDFSYDANVFTPPSPFGAWVILAPVIGSQIVTFLVQTFAREARGHGVPEVMDAIYYNEGRIRPIVATIKSLASAISIGTGAAVGREGPIIQIGASLGSTLGQIVRMAPWQRITLVAAGAGAGIAATFNTPIGGVMFAIELMMPEVSARTFLPVALATGVATFVSRLFLGIRPAFNVPANLLVDHAATLTQLLINGAIGLLAGLVAAAFVRGLALLDSLYERIGNGYLRHAIGMLTVGVLFYSLFLLNGRYYIEGVGYAAIEAILMGRLGAPALLLGLMAAKLYATTTSLGSGGSGGIFSPSLFMGATLGAAVGASIHHLAPGTGPDIANCAIVGMAAMVGGATGAAMTAVTMLFEMTRDYDIVMPTIMATALAIGVRRLLSREDIYTMKLVSRRHFVPKALHANMFMVRPASHVMRNDPILLPVDADFSAFLRDPAYAGGMRHVVVTHGERLVGVIRVNMALRRGLEQSYAGVRGRHRAKEFHHRPRKRRHVRRRLAHGAPAPRW